MTVLYGPSAFHKELGKLVDLPENARRIDIHMEVDDAVTVTCEFFPDINSEFTVTKRFRLEEIPDKETDAIGDK